MCLLPLYVSIKSISCVAFVLFTQKRDEKSEEGVNWASVANFSEITVRI